MNRLLIIAQNADEYAAALTGRPLPDLEIAVSNGTDLDDATIREANIILGVPSLVANLLPRAENLQWVQSVYAGVEPFFKVGVRRDFLLTGVKEVFGPLMSEYVFGYILALERHITEARDNQRKKNWQPIPYRSLTGVTIGICGLGSIGRHLAATAAHFGMRVLGLSRTAASTPHVEQVYAPAQINDFARQLDYLVTVLPNTPTTNKMINAGVLAQLPESAVLINVGRGATVDQQALIEALRAGRLRAAVLDVFETEPLPADSPFWEMESAWVTPHNSALSFPGSIADIFCDNYGRFLTRKPLKNLVDFERGY